MQMKSKQKEKKLLSDGVYTLGGILLMNAVLQIIVNPLLNRYMGSEKLGEELFIMGLVAILCPAVGQALNNSRLVLRREYDVSNGDYNTLVLLFAATGSVIMLILARHSMNGVLDIALTFVLLIITAFRYYGDVEYRLSLKYRNYFIYYAVLSVGYLVGFGLYRLSGNWFLVFLTGEISALLYLKVTGSVFQDPCSRSPFFAKALQRGSILIASYLVTNLTLNIDRLVLKYFVGNLSVTEYYVVSLIGKTLVMVIIPVNTIIISYLTKRETNIKRKQFLQFAGIGIGVCLVFFVCAQIATPIFIKLFYGNLYESVRSIITVVNISQILSMLSAYLFIIVLTFTSEKWQLGLQLAHMALIIVLSIVMTKATGITGFSIAVFIANLARVAAVLLLGIIKGKREVLCN